MQPYGNTSLQVVKCQVLLIDNSHYLLLVIIPKRLLASKSKRQTQINQKNKAKRKMASHSYWEQLGEMNQNHHSYHLNFEKDSSHIRKCRRNLRNTLMLKAGKVQFSRKRRKIVLYNTRETRILTKVQLLILLGHNYYSNLKNSQIQFLNRIVLLKLTKRS